MESVKNIQKLVDTAKQDAIKLAKDLADMIAGLKPLGLADLILHNPEFKKSIASLGVSAGPKAAAKAPSAPVAVKKKRTMSKAGRERIAAAAKARWAKAKAEGKTTLA